MKEHFYQNLEGFTTDSITDLYREVVLSSPDPATFVEVGSWKGKSAAFMAVEIVNSGKDITLWCVDSGLGSTTSPHGELTRNLGRPLYDIFMEGMKSGGVHRDVRTLWLPSIIASTYFDDGSLDFVFIDADHEYKSVKSDIVAWILKVKKGGILAGHDHGTEFPGVDRAVKELCPTAKHYGKDCWVYKNDTGSSD